jgi:DNA-binding NarL/FixJ family response regulator
VPVDPGRLTAVGPKTKTGLLRSLMAVQHRGTKWTSEEDRRLLELIEAGKSLVFISANLKRPVKTIRARVSRMRRSKLKAARK